MKISFLTVVTFLNVLVSAFAESTFIRGGLTNRNKDANNHPRSLALLSECNDSEEVLYKDKTCDWIAAMNSKKKMKNKCNKKTKLGMIYDLCPSTCSGVDLGRCTTFKLEETIESLRATIRDLEVPITDEDVTLNSVIFKDMKAEKEALEAALAGCTPEAVCDEKVRVAIEAATATSTPSNCTAINAEKVAVLEEQKLEKDIKIASLTGTIESVSKNLAEKDGEIEEKDTIISGHEDALRNTVAEKALLLDLAEKDQEDLADLRLTILELKETVTNVNAEMALLLEQLASDNVRQEIEEEEEEEFEKDEATNFDYADFYSTIKNEPIVVTSCSSSGSAGGDCSRSPTYCYGVETLEGRQANLRQEIKMLESDIKMLESEKIPLLELPGGGPTLDNNVVDCRFERGRMVAPVEKYRGSCSGPNSCLNLDFYCVSSTVCELNCSGGNSCKGVTMYCADNQVCAIKLCGVGTDRCVGAKVVYNGMEFGEKQGWKSPPAEE